MLEEYALQKSSLCLNFLVNHIINKWGMKSMQIEFIVGLIFWLLQK